MFKTEQIYHTTQFINVQNNLININIWIKSSFYVCVMMYPLTSWEPFIWNILRKSHIYYCVWNPSFLYWFMQSTQPDSFTNLHLTAFYVPPFIGLTFDLVLKYIRLCPLRQTADVLNHILSHSQTKSNCCRPHGCTMSLWCSCAVVHVFLYSLISN